MRVSWRDQAVFTLDADYLRVRQIVADGWYADKREADQESKDQDFLADAMIALGFVRELVADMSRWFADAKA